MTIGVDDKIVNILFFVCLFLLGISAIEHYFRNALIPAICWVLLAGIAYGTANSHLDLYLPRLHLEPGIVLFIFLPILMMYENIEKLQKQQSYTPL